jgi:tRNA 2-thiouridine synthesizing protein D
MIYCILVLASPNSGLAARSAALFVQAALARGHAIERVFFMDDGCYASSNHRVVPQDEPDAMQLWVDLAQAHKLELAVCISSAIKRALLDDDQARRCEAAAATTHNAFTISGLGQLVDATSKSDRVVTFGG